MKNPLHLLLLICICACQPGQAQTDHVDSLKLVLAIADADTNRINTLIKICISEYRSSPAEAIVYGNEARIISQRLEFKKGVALAFKYIGMGHYFQGDYWEAVNQWQQSLAAFEANNDKVGVSSILNNIGAVYNNQGDDTRALDYYLRSLKAAEETTDTSRIAIASMNIGTIYLKKTETHDKALEYYLSVLPLIETQGNQVALGTVSANLGDIYYEREDYDTALYYYEISLSSFKESTAGNIPYAMTNIGRVYMLFGLCLIYIAPIISRIIDSSDSKKKYLFINGTLGSLALFIFYFFGGFAVTAVAVLLLSLSMCYDASRPYALKFKETHELGIGKSLSIFTSFEKIGQVFGPIIFGILFISSDIHTTLAYLGGAYFFLTIIFMLTAKNDPKILPFKTRLEKAKQKL
jgi:tetratricopeptide (TPR) repeat protein